MKTLTNSGDFTGSRIIIYNSGGTQRELESSNQPLKKPTAHHLLVFLKSNTETRFKFFSIFHYPFRLTQQYTES